jgi:hypothetical protein
MPQFVRRNCKSSSSMRWPGVPPQTGADIAKSPAARLRALQELRDTDLISDAEYEAKRTEIIDSI